MNHSDYKSPLQRPVALIESHASYTITYKYLHQGVVTLRYMELTMWYVLHVLVCFRCFWGPIEYQGIGKKYVDTDNARWWIMMVSWSFRKLLSRCDPNSPVIAGFHSQRASTVKLCFFVVSFNKLLRKQARCRWFETSRLARDVTLMKREMQFSMFHLSLFTVERYARWWCWLEEV